MVLSADSFSHLALANQNMVHRPATTSSGNIFGNVKNCKNSDPSQNVLFSKMSKYFVCPLNSRTVLAKRKMSFLGWALFVSERSE